MSFVSEPFITTQSGIPNKNWLGNLSEWLLPPPVVHYWFAAQHWNIKDIWNHEVTMYQLGSTAETQKNDLCTNLWFDFRKKVTVFLPVLGWLHKGHFEGVFLVLFLVFRAVLWVWWGGFVWWALGFWGAVWGIGTGWLLCLALALYGWWRWGWVRLWSEQKCHKMKIWRLGQHVGMYVTFWLYKLCL